jgi:BMFP domain-containing protein YqiC
LVNEGIVMATDYEMLRRARSKITGLEAEVARLEDALKAEKKRAEEWKAKAAALAEKYEPIAEVSHG